MTATVAASRGQSRLVALSRCERDARLYKARRSHTQGASVWSVAVRLMDAVSSAAPIAPAALDPSFCTLMPCREHGASDDITGYEVRSCAEEFRRETNSLSTSSRAGIRSVSISAAKRTFVRASARVEVHGRRACLPAHRGSEAFEGGLAARRLLRARPAPGPRWGRDLGLQPGVAHTPLVSGASAMVPRLPTPGCISCQTRTGSAWRMVAAPPRTPLMVSGQGWPGPGQPRRRCAVVGADSSAGGAW